MSKFNFKSLFRTVTDFSSQVLQLKKELEDLKIQRKAITDAPMAREDVYAFLCYQVDIKGGEYSRRLEKACAHLMKHACTAPGDESKIDYDFKPKLFSLETNITQSPEWAADAFLVTLCFMFPDQFKDKLNEALDAWNWTNAGLPRVARIKKLKELDDKILVISNEIDEINSELIKLKNSI